MASSEHRADLTRRAIEGTLSFEKPEPMKREQRREQLLRFARDVFAEKGYHATKIDDIVAHAAVARGTFYLHFQDKRGIFDELVDSILQRIGKAIVRIKTDEGTAPPLLQLRDNVQRVIEVGLGDPGMTKILLQHAVGLDPDFDRKVRSFFRALEELLALSLLNGQRLGLVRQGDRRVLGALSLGAVKEILLQSVEGRLSSSPHELTDAVMRFLAGGILTAGLVVDAALGPVTRRDDPVTRREEPAARREEPAARREEPVRAVSEVPARVREA